MMVLGDDSSLASGGASTPLTPWHLLMTFKGCNVSEAPNFGFQLVTQTLNH
jgi:hypothetical protein